MIIALQTLSGGHLGFILFAGEENKSGDCIIRALPKDPDLWQTDEFKFLADCQDAGEFQFKFEDGKRNLRIKQDEKELYFTSRAPEERYEEKKSGLGIFGVLVKTEDEKNEG